MNIINRMNCHRIYFAAIIVMIVVSVLSADTDTAAGVLRVNDSLAAAQKKHSAGYQHYSIFG